MAIRNIPNTANYSADPWYFYNACTAGGCPDPRLYQCDVVFAGGVSKGQSTYFNLHNVAPNYSGYFEVRTTLVTPSLSFQDLVLEDEVTNAVLNVFPPETGSATLTLTTTAGTGFAVFADNNSATETVSLSGSSVQIPIKAVQASDLPSNIRLQATVSGITRELNFTIVKIDSVSVHASDPETHKIASVTPLFGKDHFVCVKDTGDLVLEAAVVPNDPTVLNQLTWEADGAAIVSPAVGSDKRTAKLPTSLSQKIPLRIKLGGTTIWEGVSWVVWANGQVGATRPIQVLAGDVQTGDGTVGPGMAVQGGYDFKFEITPPSIITDSDRPDLSGSNIDNGLRVPPPGAGTFNLVTGDDLADGAELKWDVSRRLRVKVINPNLYGPDTLGLVAGSLWDHQPVAIDVPALFPSDDRVGNDDSQVGDEEDDPYSVSSSHGSGEITSSDTPTQVMRHATGNDGETFELRLHFGEFARVLLEGEWFRCSGFFDWRAHFKIRRQAGQWVDEGSTIALDNNGF